MSGCSCLSGEFWSIWAKFCAKSAEPCQNFSPGLVYDQTFLGAICPDGEQAPDPLGVWMIWHP